MSGDDFVVLGAVPGSEQEASCGCLFVLVKQRGIDSKSGRYLMAEDAVVVIPCSKQEAHVRLARIAGEGHAAAPEQVLERFERLAREK